MLAGSHRNAWPDETGTGGRTNRNTQQFDQKYNEEQRVLESNFLPSKLNGLCVNIWDDYSETEPDPTYAYLEVSDVPDFFTNQFLTWFLPYVKAALDNEKIKLDVFFYESLSVYPSLLGSEYENLAFNRWQINFSNLPHESRERITHELNALNLTFEGLPVRVISES